MTYRHTVFAVITPYLSIPGCICKSPSVFLNEPLGLAEPHLNAG